MDTQLIERLAKEARANMVESGPPYAFKAFSFRPEALQRFAALVAEECAQIVESEIDPADLRCMGHTTAAQIRSAFKAEA